MKSFNEYLDSVGELKRHPTPIYKWAAYKAGIVSFHDSRSAALAVSKNVEQIETEESKEIRKEVYNYNVSIEQSAYESWIKDLRLEYLDMSDNLFRLIFSESYDRAHAYGYDSVAEEFIKIADFANRVLDAAK